MRWHSRRARKQMGFPMRLFQFCCIIVAALHLGACDVEDELVPVPPCPEGYELMAISTDVSATGLYLTANPLDAPPGALAIGNNAVLRRPGIAEARRGQAPHVFFSSKALSFGTFEGALVAHTENDTVEYRKTQASTLSRSGSTVTVTAVAHGLTATQIVALVDTSNATTFPEGQKTVVSTPTADTFTYTEAGTATTGSGTIASVVAYNGTYTAPDGAPMRFFEAGGALYFTTNVGPYRVDNLTEQPVLAGVPPGLEGSAATVASTGGWLSYGETVGYRLVWARRDGDGDLLLGAPSGRFLVTNGAVTITDMDRAAGVVTATVPTGHGLETGDIIEVLTSSNTGVIALGDKTLTGFSATTVTWTETGGADGLNVTGTYAGIPVDVNITTPIPNEIVEGIHFLQAYRTVLVADTATDPAADPGEDMAVSVEYFPNAAEIAAGTLTVTDFSPFPNGATGYFSPSEGQGGLLAAKLQPPLMTDVIALKSGYAICVALSFHDSIALALLTPDPLFGPDTGDGLQFYDPDANVTESFTVNNALAEGAPNGTQTWAFKSVQSSATVSVAQAIEATARSLVRAVNLSGTYFSATYTSGVNDQPGQIIVTRRNLGTQRPTVVAIQNGKAWSPTLRMYFTGNATRTANVVNVNVAGPHPALTFAVNDKIVLYGSTDPNFPNGTKTLTSAAGSNIQYAEVGADVVVAVPLTFHTDEPIIAFTQEATTSSWASSETQEYDAWPPKYRYQVGGPEATLYRIVQQNDAALFYTDSVFYRLTGNDPSDFNLQPIDSTARLVAPKTVVALSNKNLALTDQGVVLIESTNVRIVSGPINEELRKFYAGTKALRDGIFATAYAFANETEQEYWLGLPDEAFPDGAVTQFYVLNLGTGGWTRVPYDATTAWVLPSEGRIYAQPSDDDFQAITRERRNRNATDQQDADGVGIPFEVEYQTRTAKHPGQVKQWVEANVLLEKPQPAAIQLRFGSELDDTMYGLASVPTQSNGNVRTGVPRDASRSRTLKVRVNHSTAGEKIAVLGLAINANVMGLKAGK